MTPAKPDPRVPTEQGADALGSYEELLAAATALGSAAPSHPVHPGVILRMALEKRDLSQAQLALRTGLSTKHINQLVQGQVPLSPDTALLLERTLGTPSSTWNALEAMYQEAT